MLLALTYGKKLGLASIFVWSIDRYVHTLTWKFLWKSLSLHFLKTFQNIRKSIDEKVCDHSRHSSVYRIIIHKELNLRGEIRN